MTAQRGRDLLIKIGDGGSPESFTSVAGLKATSLAFNAQTVDVTNADSAGMWRELLEGGIKSASLSGSGVFKDAASDAALRQAFFDGTTMNYQVV
ncbi:MAG TPA: phage major tail protein, TP901-1 family, partial [Rhizomicrobium sp.]|nr:phage major tail protein, TP901-1 family [Rhizomicrobium sp.]